MGLLTDFITYIKNGNLSEADALAIEMYDISEIIAKSVAISLEEKIYGMDEITAAMRKTFSKEMSEINSLQELHAIQDRTERWEVQKPRSFDDLVKIAAVQDYVLNELKKRINELEILSLKLICDSYNDSLCHDHALALQKAAGDHDKLAQTSEAVLERSHAFLQIYQILHSDKKHEVKIQEFINALSHFHEVLLNHPAEEAMAGTFRKFSWQLWQLGKFSCFGNRQRHAFYSHNFINFRETVDRIIENHEGLNLGNSP